MPWRSSSVPRPRGQRGPGPPRQPLPVSRSDEVSQVSSSAGQQSTPYKWVTLGRVFRLGRSLARAPHSPARPWLRAEQPFGSTTSNKASIAPAASSLRKTESLLLLRGSSQRCPGCSESQPCRGPACAGIFPGGPGQWVRREPRGDGPSSAGGAAGPRGFVL